MYILLKKNQIGILELKSTVTEKKNSFFFYNRENVADLSWHKSETVNVKAGQLILSSLRNKKKRMKI